MIPAMGSYAHNDEDDFELDLSHFELHPDKVTTNPLFESRGRATLPFFEDDEDSFQPRPGKRLPLPTKWSSTPGTSSPISTPSRDNRFEGPDKGSPISPRYSNPATSTYYPTPRGPGSPIPQSVPVQNSFSNMRRPPSPTDSISDHLTALMLAPSETPWEHRSNKSDFKHHIDSQRSPYETEPQRFVERNSRPLSPPHRGTYSLPPTPQPQDRFHHSSNPFHENMARPPSRPQSSYGKYERPTMDKTLNSFNPRTVSHPPSPPDTYESAFIYPQNKDLPGYTSRSMNNRTAPRSLDPQRTNEATRRPMQYDRSDSDRSLYPSDKRTVPQPQIPPRGHSMRDAIQYPRDTEHQMISKSALHQELLQSRGERNRENRTMPQQKPFRESIRDDREHSKQHQSKDLTGSKEYSQKGHQQRGYHHSQNASTHPKGDVTNPQKHAQKPGPPPPPPPPPMPKEQLWKQRSVSQSNLNPQSAPSHRPRTQSMLTNGQSRHRREEIIRDFMPLDPKMPSVPLPDYEEESDCLYIPRPDY